MLSPEQMVSESKFLTFICKKLWNFVSPKYHHKFSAHKQQGKKLSLNAVDLLFLWQFCIKTNKDFATWVQEQ